MMRWELKQALGSDWDPKQNSLETLFIETKGCTKLPEKVGGEVNVPSSRKKYNSFQELEESQYGWRLKVRRGKRCHWKGMQRAYNCF